MMHKRADTQKRNPQWKTVFRSAAGRLTPPAAGILVLSVLMVLWLFVFPHGLADNGDFFRAIHNLGLSHPDGTSTDDYFRYFNNRYVLSRYYVDYQASYFTAQTPLIWLSIQLNRLFMPAGVYDIRFLAALYGLLYLAASWLLLHQIERAVRRFFPGLTPKHQTAVAYLFTALYVFLFGDFGYLLYFNSFFGEPLFYVALLLYVAATVQILSGTQPRKRWLALYFVSAVLFIGAKQQGAPLGIVVVLLTLRILALYRSAVWRALTGAAAFAVGAVSLLTYLGISDEIAYINQYHSMTLGVMRYETDADMLQAMNVPPQLLILKGTTVYTSYPAVLPDSPLLYNQMYNRISTGKIMLYYLRRPASLLHLLDDTAALSYRIKPSMTGNYLKSTGRPPGSQSYFFSGWSILKQNLFPKTFGFLLIGYLALAIVLLYWYVRFASAGRLRARAAVECVWGVQAMSAIQFVVAFVGSGEADLAKHLFYHLVLFDLLFAGALFACGVWFYRAGGPKKRITNRREASPK